MDFISADIEQYAKVCTTDEPGVLQELTRETYLKVLQPRMLSGHLQGRLLSFISHLLRPARVLEIGTYTGYSAICIAEGMPADGELITIDINDELEPIASKYVRLSANENRIKLLYGDAAVMVPKLSGHFDLIFIDADKVNYAKYYELGMKKLNPGGVLIADNVLWSGKVLDATERERDPDTAALHAFNQKVNTDQRIENMLLPVRDGLMLIRKKSI